MISAVGRSASIPSPGPGWQDIPIDLFGWHWSIHTYALCILLGIIIAAAWTSRRLTLRGGEPGVLLDILLWAVPIGIVGARAYHVFTHPQDYFYPGADLLRTLYIWEGGNAIFGAMIGGAVGILIACRLTGVRFFSFTDALVPGLLLAQAVGRVGNYVNNELFGVPTDLPWGLQIDQANKAFPVGLAPDTLFHPLFLYEMVWDLAGIVFLLFLERHFELRWGKLTAWYFIWYGAGRSYLESIRIDPSEYSFLSIPSNVWAAFGAVALGIVVLIVQSRRHPGLEPSVYRPGREWTPPDPDADVLVEDDASDDAEPAPSLERSS